MELRRVRLLPLRKRRGCIPGQLTDKGADDIFKGTTIFCLCYFTSELRARPPPRKAPSARAAGRCDG